MRVSAFVVVLSLCVPCGALQARAQSDEEAVERAKKGAAAGAGQPGPGGRQPGSAAAARPDPGCEKGCLRAEEQGGSQEHFWAVGFVDFQIGETHIQCDRLDRYAETDADGRTRSRIVAEGNVVFQRGDERLAGDRLEMDMEQNTATLENAYGYLEPEVFVEARRIHRRSDDSYRIEGGRFTSCSQPNPRWGFSASSADVKPDSRILAKNVVFRIKSVPALYLPLFYYPIAEDQRSTGLLFPRFGYSQLRGLNVGTGFFWAMGRSADQTFSVDHYADFGTGYGHELRYVGHGTSNGSLETTLFRRSDVDAWDHDLRWNAMQGLPGRFRATLNARLFSSTSFLQSVKDSLDLASSRNQRANLNVQGNLAGHTIRLTADHSETFFGSSGSRINQQLPSLRLSRSPRRIGETGIVLGYEVRAERLARGTEDDIEPYQRFDVAPSLSRPWATSFLQLEPRFGLRYTRWGASVDDDGGLEGPALDRRQFESAIEMRGPMFAKIFSLGGFFSPRFKHEIGPEVLWTYRTPVDAEAFDATPRFDGTDRILGTNQFRYSLVQRLLAKRQGRGDQLTTFELLSWRLSQTYFAQIAEGQNEFDPNYTTAFFGPGGEPSHYSPVQSRVKFEPFQRVRATFDAEYDVNYRQLRSLGAAFTAHGPRGSLSLGWSKASRLAEQVEERTPVRNTLRASASYELWPGHVDLSGAADYDFVNDKLIRSSGRVRLGVQCCALLVQMVHFDYNQRSERQFRFALELANIGSFGFGGDEQGRRR